MKTFKETPALTTLPFAFLRYRIALVVFAGILFMQEKESKEIPLTQGYVAIVDAENFEELSKYKWHVHFGGTKGNYLPTPYAERSVKVDGRIKHFLMHRVIMGIYDPSAIVDHRDGDGLNNRKLNLRQCSKADNSRNSVRRIPRGDGLKYIGVNRSRTKTIERWEAYIRFDGKKKYLGTFKTEEEAARERDKWAKIHHGEFAVLNFKENS